MDKLPMDNIKELYVLDRPIKTRIGNMHFFKVKEYPEMMQYTPYVSMQKDEFVNMLNKEEMQNFLKETIFKELDKDSITSYIQQSDFITLIRDFKELFDLYNRYKELFILVFKEDVIDLIHNDEEFESIKSIIKDMNNISTEKINPNPEIQRFIDIKKQLDKRKGGEINFESIYTSVYLEIGKDIEELSIFNLHTLFNRISAYKNYDTTTLFATVSEKSNIESWYKPMKVESSKEEMSMNELVDKIGI